MNYKTGEGYVTATGASQDFSPSSQDAYALWKMQQSNAYGALADVDAGNVSGMIGDLNGIRVSLSEGIQPRKGLTSDQLEQMFEAFESVNIG